MEFIQAVGNILNIVMIISLITNCPKLARPSDGLIDRIMIDLEYLGKKSRQTGKDLFQSEHIPDDVPKIKSILNHTKLVVRVNSIHDNTLNEVNRVIEGGADVVMLPYFKTIEEVNYFISCVNQRATVSLLIETKEAVELLKDIIKIDGIDEYHIGLNDLSISLGNDTIFKTIVDGTIKKCVDILKTTSKPYGFGGIGSMSNRKLTVDPFLCLSEQIRQGCSIGWLGRSFRNLIDNETNLVHEIKLLRSFISELENISSDKLQINHDQLIQQIQNEKEKLALELKPFRI